MKRTIISKKEEQTAVFLDHMLYASDGKLIGLSRNIYHRYKRELRTIQNSDGLA